MEYCSLVTNIPGFKGSLSILGTVLGQSRVSRDTTIHTWHLLSIWDIYSCTWDYPRTSYMYMYIRGTILGPPQYPGILSLPTHYGLKTPKDIPGQVVAVPDMYAVLSPGTLIHWRPTVLSHHLGHI